jgi:hypothetical protein
MLTTRPAKRDKVGFFNTDLMFDILDDGNPVGSLVYDKKKLAASITLGDRRYAVARASDQKDENVFQALLRVMTGSEKPPANPWVLKDAEGRTVAMGERVKQSFAVSRGEEGFTFRRVSRPYHLFRPGSEQSLGWVGQEKFFTRTLHMNLPLAEFDAAFQAFLLTLLLSLMMEQADSGSSYT